MSDHGYVAGVDLAIAAWGVNVRALELIRREYGRSRAENELPDHADVICEDQPVTGWPARAIYNIALKTDTDRNAIVVVDDSARSGRTGDRSVGYVSDRDRKNLVKFGCQIGIYEDRYVSGRIVLTERYRAINDRRKILRSGCRPVGGRKCYD